MKFDIQDYTSADIEELEMRALRLQAQLIVAQRSLEQEFGTAIIRATLEDVASFPDEVKAKAISLSGLGGIISTKDF